MLKFTTTLSSISRQSSLIPIISPKLLLNVLLLTSLLRRMVLKISFLQWLCELRNPILRPLKKSL